MILPNISNFNMSIEGMTIVKEISKNCKDSIDVNEIVKSICNQYQGYIRTLGLSIVISYIIVTLGGWWFFNHGYKVFKVTYFNNINNRIYWDAWIRHVHSKWAVGFIIVVIWLSF